MKKIIVILNIILIILILNITVVKANAQGMTGYEEGTLIIEITLLNSNQSNSIKVWRVNYNLLKEEYKKSMTEKQFEYYCEQYIENYEIKNCSIDNNLYRYDAKVNLYIQDSPYIEITRNDGETDTFSYTKINDVILKNEIPISISYDCEKGIFTDNTDYDLVKKIEKKEQIIEKISEFKLIIIIRNYNYYINHWNTN